MKTILSIDPGRNLGLAVFRDGFLAEANLYQVTSLRDLARDSLDMFDKLRPDSVIIEEPRIYPLKKWKGDPNDILKLAILVGVVVATSAPFAEAELVQPHTWKGNRPKAVDNDYTLSLLTEPEEVVLALSTKSKSKLHNVLDAVGLGLWRLGRR